MSSAKQIIQRQGQVEVTASGRRFDQVVADLFPEFSRSRLQQWIKSGQVTLDGEIKPAKYRVIGGEIVTVEAELVPEGEWRAEPIALDIVHEDDALIVINKPMGLVVHPGSGNHDGTLLNALLYHAPQLENVPRAGIVHRLDKDTTGLMVVAKTLKAHTDLVQQLQAREMHRQYEAVVQGVMTGGGEVEARIGRHPQNRLKMAVLENGGKEAITHYRVLKRFHSHTHIRLQLETGRTHQIRVHMAHIGYPLVGDSLYQGRGRVGKGLSVELRQTLLNFPRQALHAIELGLYHPETGDECVWQTALPDDFAALLVALEQG